MPRISVHSVADAPEGSKAALEGLQAQLGKVLNIHGEMAHSPAALGAYTGIQQAITDHGTFDARTREAIALAVAAVDNCDYCQSAYTLAGRAAGWTLEETRALRDHTPLPGQEKLTELFAHVMANIYTNYFNHYAHTELDIPAAPGLRSSVG